MSQLHFIHDDDNVIKKRAGKTGETKTLKM